MEINFHRNKKLKKTKRLASTHTYLSSSHSPTRLSKLNSSTPTFQLGLPTQTLQLELSISESTFHFALYRRFIKVDTRSCDDDACD